MNYDELIDFIEHRMRMSHVYQPLLIRSLVDAGGSATIRQIARAFLQHDESQVRYYESRIKAMPVRVLERHGVIRKDGELISLTASKLNLEQQALVRLRCEERLQSFIASRGLAIWDYRLFETDPVPDSTAYLVFARAGGRCELCGATKTQRPLEIDHIVPRSRGGRNDISNLQVLCSRCNRAKSNKDQTDFRDKVQPDTIDDCIFCQAPADREVLAASDAAFAISDAYPVATGHTLVVPRRHSHDLFTMTAIERSEVDDLLRVMRHRITADDESVTGFNVGVNCGESAGQTVMHAHVHLIPRRDGDMQDPRGGVRGVIPGRRSYLDR